MKVLLGGYYQDVVAYGRKHGLSPRDIYWVPNDCPDKLRGLELKADDIVNLGADMALLELANTSIR